MCLILMIKHDRSAFPRPPLGDIGLALIYSDGIQMSWPALGKVQFSLDSGSMSGENTVLSVLSGIQCDNVCEVPEYSRAQQKKQHYLTNKQKKS
jgi:hypothetical protein